jgi:hypothetical protein
VIEDRFGLTRAAPADRTAARRPARGEAEQAARRGWDEPPRVRRRREVCTAAAGAGSEQEFFTRLAGSGVLVRQRYSTTRPGEVSGYAVGLPQHATRDGGTVWYGGGKLAADLTLPKLRQRWAPAGDGQGAFSGQGLSPAAARAVLRNMVTTAAGQAHDEAGFWELRRAAGRYDRAARARYGAVPVPTGPGNQLRQAARLLSMAGPLTGDTMMAAAVLAASLAALAVAVAELREAQHLAAQAAAARAGRGSPRSRRAPARGRPCRPASGTGSWRTRSRCAR